MLLLPSLGAYADWSRTTNQKENSLNLHQNVHSNNTSNNAKKLPILAKLGVTLLFSLILLTASMSFNHNTSQAATVHINSQKQLVTVAKVAELKSLHTSARTNEHKSLAIPVSFKVQKPLAATTPATVTPATTDVASIIHQVFGVYANQAMNIAMCESSMNPAATNSYAIGNSHAEGLFQILYPSTWYGTSEAQASPYDATANTKAAYEIFVRDGYSWREWECRP